MVAPTCTEKGYTLHECSCGYRYRDAETAALGHNFVTTGMDSQYRYYECTRCGLQGREEAIPLPTPPYEIMGLEDEVSPTATGCTPRRVLTSTITEAHSYIYAGGRLLHEAIITTSASGDVSKKVLDFAYDAQGTPYSLTYTDGTGRPVTFYYITNLQGDVTYLINSSGNKVAAYEYDPYGKVTYSAGTMAKTNPLRYRGYCYDADTEFYYLQSRYYDANICRFTNADSYTDTGTGILGCNMFAYCENNPVAADDPGGEFWHIVIGAAVGAIIGAVSSVVTQTVTQLSEGKSISKVKINGADVAIAAGTGAVSGGLAASGLGLGVQVLGNAALSMAGNATSQVVDNKGFDNFDVGSMLLDGAIGAAAGLAGGSGAGNKGLTRLGCKTVKRTVNALTHKGVRAATKEFSKAIGYFGKNARHIVKPLAKAFRNSGLTALGGGIAKALWA